MNTAAERISKGHVFILFGTNRLHLNGGFPLS